MGVVLSMRYAHTAHSPYAPAFSLSTFDAPMQSSSPTMSSLDDTLAIEGEEQPLLPPHEHEQHMPVPAKELDKDEMRQYMHTHSLKGAKMAKSRQPFVGEIVTVDSPSDPEVEFGIRRVGNREYITHKNLSSKIRYIPTDGDDGFVSEKDYPVGDMNVSTALLGLASWNIEDASGARVEINRENLLAYTTPEELDFIYEQVLEINPVLSGKDKAKNS